MSSKLSNEGVSSGIAPFILKEVDPPPIKEEFTPNTPDEYWKEVGTVEEVFVYPVKSMRGISVQSATVGKYGLSSGKNVDRQFMIVSEAGKRMITGRRYPNIVLISANCDEENNITFSAPNMSDISVEIPTNVYDEIETDVFGSSCKGYDMGDAIAKWLSKFILNEEGGLRLITHIMPSMERGSNWFSGIRKKFKADRIADVESTRAHHSDTPIKPFCLPDDVPLFADGFGYLLLTEASVNKLNDELKDNGVSDLVVEKTRFRPNIYVSGTKSPFEEDSWLYIRIGDCLFRNAALCTRCVFTTVNPKTGEKHPNQEPLKTLKKFRKTLDRHERKVYGDSPFFGINLGVDKCGTIKVGDKILIGQPILKE